MQINMERKNNNATYFNHLITTDWKHKLKLLGSILFISEFHYDII
jgi:hypothetical protein